MNQIFFEDVRCFNDRHSCPVKPLTLLVGENSSGKTTFLALARIAWDIVAGNLSGDLFNEEPFLLGSYDQIASFRGGKAGRAKSFMIGMQIELRSSPRQSTSNMFADSLNITAQFTEKGSQPSLDEWRFEWGQFRLVVKESVRQSQLTLTVSTPLGARTIVEQIPFGRRINRLLDYLSFLPLRESQTSDGDTDTQVPIISEDELGDLQGIGRQIPRLIGQRPYAFAPIRTRPRRTYDPLKEVAEPEGSHVPMILSRILLNESGSGNGLREALTAFGKASGLFSNLEIKRKGYKESDPFQIGVKTIGPSVNLVDVGYGVSQVLPIIVDIARNPSGSTFLLQQPEVHLHPKAQAELGSFLVTLAKEQNKRFIVETHSDYLLDRVRMDIRDRKHLAPEDVAILYFERSQAGADIYELGLDQFGNIINTPPTYRQFFLQEERRILGL